MDRRFAINGHGICDKSIVIPENCQLPRYQPNKDSSIFSRVGASSKSGAVQWYIAAKRSKVKAIQDETLRELTEQIEHMKASICAAVEHPFRVIKRQFGHVKARYRGLAKNGAQVLTLFALSNLWMSREYLLAKTR